MVTATENNHAPGDLNPRWGEGQVNQTNSSPLSVMLVMGDPLCQQAVGALLDKDPRFVLAESATAEHSRQVALVDARRLSHGWARLLQASRVTGCVMLHPPGVTASHLVRPPAEVRQVNVTWDAPWVDVGQALQSVASLSDSNGSSSGPVSAPTLVRIDTVEVVRSLTQREREVLRLIAEGCSVREAATALHLAESTIDNHKSRLMKKVGVRKSIDLARFAYRAGLAIP